MDVDKVRFLIEVYDSLIQLSGKTWSSVHLDREKDSVNKRILELKEEIYVLIQANMEDLP